VNAAYLDASALVKLFKAEPETVALRAALSDWPVQVASELIRVEAICTARRLGDDDVLARAMQAVEQINLLPLTPEIIERATDAYPPTLRAMDAIHLATALTMRGDLDAMFVYDSDLHAAAQAHDLKPPRTTMTPSQERSVITAEIRTTTASTDGTMQTSRRRSSVGRAHLS
jgi:predicted nucleic acid-binding protein